MAPQFDMKKVTTPGPGRFKASIDKRFPVGLVDLAALRAYVDISLEDRVRPLRLEQA